MKENEGQGEALDLAMAMVDQSDLYSRLKMKPLYPELMEEEEEEIKDEEKEEKEETAMEGFVNGVTNKDTNEGEIASSEKKMPGCKVHYG